MSSLQEHFDRIQALLNSAQPEVALPPALRDRLLQAGAVQALLEDASEPAIALLESSARACPAPDAARQSAEALLTLSLRGNPAARAGLFRLALEDGLPQPVEWIRQHRINSPLAWQERCFAFLYLTLPEYLAGDPHLEKLLRVYLTQIPAVLRSRLSAHARKLGQLHWVELAEGLFTASDESLIPLVDRYDGYTQFEKAQLRLWLDEQARNGAFPAQNALCELFLRNDDAGALQLALQHGYQPADPSRKALFLFLTGQWAAYEVLDFTHQQINAAYESAGPALRQRILSHSRLSGHTEWLQNLGEARRRRWLKDMSASDWRSVLQQFESGRDWQQAWRLITHAPPLWAAHLIGILFSAGWQPETQAERQDFLNLVSLAQRALRETPEISAAKILKTPAPDITAAALRGDGKSLATGGSDQRLYLWDLPSGDRRGDVISGPSQGARALALSPDGQFLAAAFGDHSIRIFRIEDGRLVKTLEGHNGLVRTLLFHPDGRTLFSASFDGTLRAWRFPLGPEFARLQPGMGELFAATIDARGESLAIAGSQVQTWRWPQGEQLQALPAGGETTLQLSLAAGLPLLAGCSRDGALRVWNISSGRLLQQIAHSGAQLSSLALSQRGEIVLGGDKEGVVSAWDTSTGELLQSMQVHEKAVVGLHWFAEASFMSASQEGRVVLWDARLLNWVRQPLDSFQPQACAEMQAMQQEKFHSAGVKTWLSLILELMSWKNRFDILLEEAGSIHLDAFDIEL